MTPDRAAPRERRLVAAAAVAAIALSTWSNVRAQAGDTQGSPQEAGYEQAIAAALERYAARDWACARAAFARAHALKPGARTLRGLGLSAYYGADYVAAALAFEQALEEERHPLTAEQRAEVRDLLARTYHHVAQVRVRAVPSDAAIRIGDRSLTSDQRVLLAPGHHALEISSPGYASRTQPFEVAAGEQLNLHIELAPEPEPAVPAEDSRRPDEVGLLAPNAAAPAPPPAAAPVPPPAAAPTQATIAPWVAAGVTLAAAGSAAVFAVLAADELDDIQSRCDRSAVCDADTRQALWDESPIETYETMVNVSLVAAGACAITTAALFMITSQSALGLRASSVLGPNRAALRLAARF